MPTDESRLLITKMQLILVVRKRRAIAIMARWRKPYFPTFNDGLHKSVGRYQSMVNYLILAVRQVFLKVAHQAGWQVHGVELSQEMAKAASESLGIPIYQSLEALPTRPLDVITFWEVIEHLPSPLQQLRRCTLRYVQAAQSCFRPPTPVTGRRFVNLSNGKATALPLTYNFLPIRPCKMFYSAPV